MIIKKRPKCEDLYQELIKIKKTNSAFNSVINCLASFPQLYSYLLEKEINLKNPRLKKPEQKFNKNFIDALQGAKTFRNEKSDHINRFINCFYEKILFYDNDEVIPPINIIIIQSKMKLMIKYILRI